MITERSTFAAIYFGRWPYTAAADHIERRAVVRLSHRRCIVLRTITANVPTVSKHRGKAPHVKFVMAARGRLVLRHDGLDGVLESE